MGRFYYWLFGGSLIWFPQVYLHLCIALVDTYAPTYLLILGKILGLLIFGFWFSQLILAGLSILPPGSHCEKRSLKLSQKVRERGYAAVGAAASPSTSAIAAFAQGSQFHSACPKLEEPAGRKLTLFGNMIFRAACLHRNEYWIVYGDNHSY